LRAVVVVGKTAVACHIMVSTTTTTTTGTADFSSSIRNNGSSPLSGWIWRLPPFVDQDHDNPLCVQISDLFQDFPYNRLKTTTTISTSTSTTTWAFSFPSLLMHPYFLLGAVGFYLISIPLLGSLRHGGDCDNNDNNNNEEQTNKKKSSVLFQAFVALHNLALAIFSGVCAWNTCLITLDNLITNGVWSTCCDTDGQFWNNRLGGWAFLFYVSKYYEFVDTWILVLKKGAGRSNTTLFLQVYHHAGIVMILWAAVASQSAWQFVSNLLNSVIHTFMYT
jgi:hypothetical protein